MSKSKFTADYFIKKFSAIPAKQWISGELGHDAEGPHCALGHLGVTSECKAHENPEAKALGDILAPVYQTATTTTDEKMKNIKAGSIVPGINDDDEGIYYSGKTPKQRILNALKKAKNKLGTKKIL